MTLFRGKARLFAVAGLIVGTAGGTFAGATTASASTVVSQVEISANCDNPSFSLCQEVGTGGVWAWAALDAGANNTSGTMDATFAGCGHTIGGVGGPGGAGGHGGRVEGGVWSTITSLADAPPGASPFFDPSKSYPAYRVLDFFPGSGADDFIAIVPAPQGHYSWHPVAGVSIQTQIAP
jgi:hypothetical protein